MRQVTGVADKGQANRRILTGKADREKRQQAKLIKRIAKKPLDLTSISDIMDSKDIEGRE